MKLIECHHRNPAKVRTVTTGPMKVILDPRDQVLEPSPPMAVLESWTRS